MKTEKRFKSKKKKSERKFSSRYYYLNKGEIVGNKQCPCIHQTSTPIRFGFDIDEDFIFVPGANLTLPHNKLSDAFISSAKYEKISSKFQIKKKLLKVKKRSKKGAVRALTFVLCSLL